LADAPTRRNRVKAPRKDKDWYAGRVRTRTPTEQEEEETGEEEKASGFPSRNAETARFSDMAR